MLYADYPASCPASHVPDAFAEYSFQKKDFAQLNIRLAVVHDLDAINAIYNQAVDAGCYTGDIRHITHEERIGWFADHDPERYPVLVAELDGEVLGWASLSPYRKGREGLRFTGEISYYVHEDHQRRGIGSVLVGAMIDTAKELKYKTLIAILFAANTGSIRLLEKYRFEKWGMLPDVIEIDDKVYSHLYYGLKLGESAVSARMPAGKADI